MGRPSIRDVAALAGVAVSTVSVVLNEVEGARASSATRQRVQEAARTLGYTPNVHARGLRARGASTIAFLSDGVATGPYAGGLLQGVQEACWQRDLTLVVLNTDSRPDRERTAWAHLAGQRLDGVLLASVAQRPREVPDGFDVVVLNGMPAPGGRSVPHLVPANREGAVRVGEELAGLGHRRVGVLAVEGSVAADERVDGVRDGLAEHRVRLAPNLVSRSSRFDATAAGGYAAAGVMLDRRPAPTALFCFNDRMAMGAYRAAAERGLRVPDDLSIVGYDDMEPIAESLHPALTTVALPHLEMGERAVEILLDADHPARAAGSHRVEVACPLVLRHSAGPAPSGDTHRGERALARGP